MDIYYRIPAQVRLENIQENPVLVLPGGGKIAIDISLADFWKKADGKSLSEMLKANNMPNQTQACLACLAEAGLLERIGIPPINFNSSYTPINDADLVSIIILGYKGKEWLTECIPSIQAQTYPSIEIIVVDNCSNDDTADWVELNFPQVKVIRLEVPESFAKANNIGAEIAKGKYFLFMNQDLRLEPEAITRMVEQSRANPNAAAIGCKLKFWWAPQFLNAIGNAVREYSWGFDIGLGILDMGQYDDWLEIPSACFAAVLIPKNAWQELGPMDPDFPFYYEDVEWCYRARLLGKSIVLAPQAVAYHAFGGKVPGSESDELTPRKLTNVVYGRMRFALKLVGDDLLPLFQKNYIQEDSNNYRNALIKFQWKHAKAYQKARKMFIRDREKIKQTRDILQSRRVVTDEHLFALPFPLPPVFCRNGLPELTYKNIASYYLPLIKSGRIKNMPEFDHLNTDRTTQLLIISNDTVDKKMAGPGMRYLEMARALSRTMNVTLAIPTQTTLNIPEIRMVTYQENNPTSLQVLVENHDVALISGYMIEKFPFLKTTSTRLIVDLYDPFFFENLHYYLHEPIENQEHYNSHAINIANELIKIGDYFICGNERQRDLWMGMLAANNRVNPRTFHQDETLRSLIDIVGVGFPDREITPRSYLRGKHPAFDEKSKIVLWGGGIWNWLDPITLARAWKQVAQKHPEARLVFLGTRHPNPLVPQHEIVQKLIAEAEQTGEKDKSIFFIEWLSYEDREALLSESNIGVTLHPIHVETRYSIRTRVLDYLWARLPVLITTGDITSEWVDQYKIGKVVPPFDADAVVQALDEMLSIPKEEWQPAFDAQRKEFTWSTVVLPLQNYCLNGNIAADRLNRANKKFMPPPPPPSLSNYQEAILILRTHGLKGLFDKTIFHINWLLKNRLLKRK